MSTITCDAAHVAPKMELPKIKPYTEPQLAALYTNTELLTLEEFTNQYVEAELKGLAVKHHHLYDLLMNYLHVREKITGNNLELQQFRKEYKDLQSELWSVYSAEVTGRAECQDGAIVTASHSYNKSIFHRNVFQTVVRLLGNIQRLTYENHVLYSYSAEDLKLQIELFLQSVITNCMNVTQLNRDAKVALTMQAEPMHLKPYLGELRLCISVLFSFQRKLIRDKKFLKETREWLGRLVGILLRVANYQDHLFILNHILRCPSGVGNWASNFVQLPLQEIPVGESPFSNYQINHLVTILASILMPIKEREKFLEDIAQGSDTATEALWVMVDSEGEEDEETSGTSLRENDLVALLNQLPLDNMFRSLLLIQKRNLKDCYDASLLSEHHILRFFSFSTTLLKIFHRGLDTYRQARYNQFSKRLSRFIRHVTQYATDQWEQFLATQDGSDAAMVAKLQVEYDAFFLRAIFYLYSSQKLGAWQFLAVVPYHLVTVGTLWKIFYFLHSSDSVAKDILSPLDDKDYSKMLWEQTLRSQFEEKVNNLEDAETYYLLNTFANMALARSDDDMEFIHTAAMDLLQIGFINESTQDTCSKSSKILLTHITSKHPHLLSNILKKVKENMETIKELALYLYEELPLTIWKIEEVDLKTLSKLLLNNPITSNESKLTRMILSRLNWDNIPYETHCDVAVLAVQAADLEPGYLQWAWQTVLRLKLHINDKKFQEFGRVEDLEKFDVLSKGVREQKPLASFVAVLMTSWGHAVPLICSKGLPQLTFLQHHQKHEAVLFALYEIMPLFIDSQECIINCEKYQEVLQNLLNADRGYISMAKSLIGVQSTVLQQFGNMIETQIVNYTYYDLESPRVLVRLWMNSLVSIPNWNRDFGVIYLLDVIVKTAFFHRDALDVAYNILRELIQCSTPQEQSGTISSLFKWVSSANTNGSLLLSSLTSYTYIAYIMIELEHVEREQKTGLWKELLVQLSKQKGKINVDQAIKTPWYEYLDYEKLKKDQQLSIKTWRVCNFREKTNVNQPLLGPGKTMESANPVERILRRLQSYDPPKPPPEVAHSAPVIAPLNFSCKEDMIKSLEVAFKTLIQFSHNHIMKISEHKALDCSYQELMPQLYRSVLNKVKKKVPCKGKNQTVHCSGAAVVILEMEEARINDRIDHQIQSNRNAYESLLAKSLQAPALVLCTSSITLQQAIRILQQQIRCNPATAELGVELFYYLLSLMSEEILNYPPTKNLLTSCLERLGQSHICNSEPEMPRLLDRILKEPNLGGYLAPHFSPSKVGTINLLTMYSTISKEIGQKYDIAFALLSKFEVETWLTTKEPKLSHRSQFIQTVVRALTSLGFDPPVQSLMLHNLYRKHLLTVFNFQFPEHYGEVIVQLLKASNANADTNLLSVSVWLDVLNSLGYPVQFNLKASPREQLRQYAQHQKMLQHQELLETAELLARHFTKERFQYGLYGLYPKCRNYMDVFVLYMGMTGHGLVISTLNVHQGKLDDQLCEKIWPLLRDMFAPWLVPYSMQNLKDNMASWIQQLADDRSVLLPWIPADGGFAQKVVHVFFECVQFIILTLPACNNILSYLWQWYVTSFAHNSVKDHILHPIHQTFLGLHWHNFWPSVVDLDFMLRVIDQYLPDCHSFLGHIFMSVNWPNWLNNFGNSPPQIKSRVYQCFMNLLVKLCNEPNVRNRYSEKAKALLVQAENFDWSFLEPQIFQHVLDWYVMSCDSSVIFKNDPLNLDYRVLHFLKTVSGCNRSLPSDGKEVLIKRLIFIRTFIKLLSVYSSKHKSHVPSKESEISSVITRQLNEIEIISTSPEDQIEIISEMLHILNITNLSHIGSKAFMTWIKNKSGDSNTLECLLKSAGVAVNDLNTLGDILETLLTSYFQNTAGEPSWKYIGENINILPSKLSELEQLLLEKGCILSLNAILVQRMAKYNDAEALLNTTLNWLMNIKISEDTESKIPLLWCAVLQLSLKNCGKDEPSTAAILCQFCQILTELAEDKGSLGWGRGLLSKIGISKQGVSLNFRFLCRALAGYILAQLPDMKGEPRMVRHQENAPFKVGQPGGNTDCVKLLLSLDFGQSQGQIKECAELALKQIQDPLNSMHNAKKFLFLLVKQFYLKSYLRDIG
ncbi:unnamed protein product [Brassicogethes aeneus]|uniref:Epg5-like central TPR repeats domain-containing protein n=1 Tax=Brassicogethes aeneus TaxID=1431903 RepID=A0A9P0BCV9_BRAAE|nr:unnamed protein product [Brassicogethes aeneus]